MAKTPMLIQYQSIKEQHPDAILFFRLGDFYEMFYQDALIASKILEITLTSRNKGESEPVPLCGIPYHSARPYIAKLLDVGKKVAICEQVEDVKNAKGIVKREVVQIITPGMVIDDNVLRAAEPNYAMSLLKNGSYFGYAYLDFSTGEFRCGQFDNWDSILHLLAKLRPKELLLESAWEETAYFHDLKMLLSSAVFNFLEQTRFDPKSLADLKGVEAVSSQASRGLAPAGALMNYVSYTQKTLPQHINQIKLHKEESFLQLDESAIRHLELVKTEENERQGSLLHLLDQTDTSLGARLLREWLLNPLMAIDKIEKRQKTIGFFLKDSILQKNIEESLKKIADLERLIGRISLQSANARDLVSLKVSVRQFPALQKVLKASQRDFDEYLKNLAGFEPLASKINSILVDEPPHQLKDGGLIRENVNRELDDLRQINKKGKGFIAAIENKERKKTGINSLKVKYNRVFGYYIEVTHVHKDKIPVHYIRKQTLVNAERYITPELKEYEEKVLGAQEKIQRIEFHLFAQLREEVLEWGGKIQKAAASIAKLDALSSLAKVASLYNWSPPKVDQSGLLQIDEGRHPIVEMNSSRFVPNDISLNNTDQRFIIITGPNMAGKSTSMRLTAIITLLSQMGSYVPAKMATIGLVDKIFTRVGAHDRLSKGESTFMVEMRETSNILKQATNRSLIIIDEIGRGTSTFDGVAIAWAIAEYIHNQLKARTLFATHYHELVELTNSNKGMENYNIAVKEWNNEIVFLRRLIKGSTSKSYGIEVARLAGLPSHVIKRAKEVLHTLENTHISDQKKSQLSLFEAQDQVNKEHPAIDLLRKLNLDDLTPIEGLNQLYKIKNSL